MNLQVDYLYSRYQDLIYSLPEDLTVAQATIVGSCIIGQSISVLGEKVALDEDDMTVMDKLHDIDVAVSRLRTEIS